MGSTLVMSYPAADWNASAGRSPRAGAPANPRAALREWIALADAILFAGGHILVCDPPKASGTEGAPRPLSLPYAADWGMLVRRNDQALFLLSTPSAPHRAAEGEVVKAFFTGAGVPVQAVPGASSGRGDLVQVSPGRYLYLASAQTDANAGGIVAKEVGAATRWIEGAVAPPWRFADEVATVLTNKANDVVMLVHEAGMKGRTIPELRTAYQKVDVIPVDQDDAEAGACTALCVNGTVIHPPGLSTTLRGHLVRRGFLLVELELPELRGRAGGGAHALVNELFGFVIGAGAPDYPRARDRIVALVDTYPESA